MKMLSTLLIRWNCLRAWWYHARAEDILRSGRYATKDGRHAFGYFSKRSHELCPPGCPVWREGVSRAAVCVEGHFSSQ
jgi:hypothetical protein